jgi:uncharacterized protein YbgA (DUF1722 family)/uncharacterized protein YbbK (DUF523 family)
MITSHFVEGLKPFVDFITVCPEVEIGLGTPRKPIRIVSRCNDLRLIQSKTGLDVTEKMQQFISSFLDSLPEVDGFILKSRSPTSALKDAKVYPSEGKSAPSSRGPGFMGREVLKRFSKLPIEDEGRLRNPRIKEHFLVRIYILADFRRIRDDRNISGLADFTARNEILFDAYSKPKTNILRSIMHVISAKTFTADIQRYENSLLELLRRPPNCNASAKAMIKVQDRLKKLVSSKEKNFLQTNIHYYVNAKAPISLPMNILRSWVIRFDENDLSKQTFLAPYPNELADIETMTAYCDGKDYW